MSAVEPPRLASWLLGRFVCGQRRESLIGDLDEQFGQGRSSSWYWRQVLSAILVAAARDLRQHKLLASRAVVVGWVVVPWVYFTLTVYQRTAPWIETRIPGIWFNGSALQRLAWWAWWIYNVPLFIAWCGGSLILGWMIARLHREHRAAMLFACVASQLPWTVLWAWPAWRIAYLSDFYTPYTFPNQVVAVLTLVGMPICTLLGGLWGADDIGVSTRGIRRATDKMPIQAGARDDARGQRVDGPHERSDE
jgi:hypothetical protein